ncbi:FHA domain-containing protein [Pseudarthrobacter sp. NamE2]|uniref:FtsK/SpoIIIE domain-containing protein n=1 Tax=Pseudarthrobacter sp. NamE2 TaxID=2576838 RepID=UPI0010FDB025|nr:FtsK/SpoIIIE domain-containing protein [Pseudarthrobacter sp. NamE2]TLM85643.1 FHA domain-containing protein [Pseudarthrobacter sp. NamE2]
MTLHCTLVRGPESHLPAGPLELTIDAPEGASGADVCEHLEEKFGTGSITVNGEDLRSLRLGTAPFVNGAVLLDGGAAPLRRKQRNRRPESTSAAPLALAVHTGAGAGIVMPLRRGVYTLGRSDATVVIADAELSRHHARLVVTDKDIFIEDLDSANGTYVNGEQVRNAAVTTGSSIRCGNTTMSLMFTDVPDIALIRAGAPVKEPIAIPGRNAPSGRGALLVTAALPLAIGVGLAVFTGMWMFLAFAATSAFALLIPLLAGRRQQREFAAAVKDAVHQDRERRMASGPSLATLVLALGQAKRPPPQLPEEGGVCLRLGQANQSANITINGGTTPVNLPSAGEVPVLFSLSGTRTVFQGTPHVLDGMIRSLLMQVSGYPRCRHMRVVVHGQPGNLPLAARYLPQVTLTATADACRQALTQAVNSKHSQGVLVLPRAPADATTTAALVGLAIQNGWHVLEFQANGSKARPADVTLSENRSTLRRREGNVVFVPDLAPVGVFNACCRQLAAVPYPAGSAEPNVPTACGLEELLTLSAVQTAARWDASAVNDGLAAPLGRWAVGTTMLDLHADGPHLLVAGTTGSGKSELLRTLTLGLALSYPPDRVNFLFVDFKGGSGLGPLTGLVHCVGLLTDLKSGELERTLISLRAEIKLREEALAAARVPDLAAYRSTGAAKGFALPHLVIIIDEFRMLVDHSPEVLRELLRIAAIGRSLGIHLVMATQRPQGALTADIRANVTTSIALRVQSEMESVDIIGTKAASAISIGTPGRAFLARGTEPPQEFQAATTGRVQATADADDISVQLATDYLISGPSHGESDGLPTPVNASTPMVTLICDTWAARQGAPPRAPVAPPLPQDIEEPLTDYEASSVFHARERKWTLQLGLMDLPDAQRLEPLTWGPVRDGHIALIGAPGSGAGDALQLAVRRLLAQPSMVFCYLLDSTGTFHSAAGHARVGAVTGLHELRRAVRVLERLAEELAHRLSRPDHDAVPLVLMVSGWGSWVSAFRAGPLAPAEDLVHDLVRDGARAGITVMISGNRELVHARFSGALPNRLYFPADSNDDSRLAWPRMPSTAAVRGRAVAFGPVSHGGPAVCQLYRPATGHDQYDALAAASAGHQDEKSPFRVEPLPERITTAEINGLAGGPSGAAAPDMAGHRQAQLDLLIGVGGDEPAPVSCRLQAGAVLAVLGSPGSGKTNFLTSLQALHPGRRWLSPRAEDTGDDRAMPWAETLAAARAGRLAKDTVLLADDADLMSPTTLRDLGELQELGMAVILTAAFSPLLLQRVPLMMRARASGTGILLCPRTVSDGDVFGVRFEVEPSPPPGRAVHITGGRATAIQTPWGGSERSIGVRGSRAQAFQLKSGRSTSRA